MVVDVKDALAQAQAWKKDVLEPWKAQMAAYNEQKAAEMEKMKAHAAQLETIVGLLLDGKTRAAMLAWNALQLHPKLRDLRVGGDGETLTLVDVAGTVTVLKLDVLMQELQALLQGE